MSRDSLVIITVTRSFLVLDINLCLKYINAISTVQLEDLMVENQSWDERRVSLVSKWSRGVSKV
jgi:hypothetical protein